MQYMNLRDPRALSELSRPDLMKLRMFLKGVYVKVVMTRMRPRPISDVVIEAALQEFDKEGERITVQVPSLLTNFAETIRSSCRSLQKHFETKYNVQVKFPRCVGVRIGKTAVIPAEFCDVIPGQVYRKKIPPQIQKGFLEFATQRPEARLEDIRTAVTQNVRESSCCGS